MIDKRSAKQLSQTVTTPTPNANCVTIKSYWVNVRNGGLLSNSCNSQQWQLWAGRVDPQKGAETKLRKETIILLRHTWSNSYTVSDLAENVSTSEIRALRALNFFDNLSARSAIISKASAIA